MSRYNAGFVFRPGAVVSAEELNANFHALERAINDDDQLRPGFGVNRENMPEASIPPTALEKPHVIHAWGIPLREDTFTSGGIKYWGLDSDHTTYPFQVAKPDQNVTIVRISVDLGEPLEGDISVGTFQFEVDGSEVGDRIAVSTLNPAVVDVSHDVSAGSVVTLKYDHIEAKAVGGMAWIYAKSLPWI